MIPASLFKTADKFRQQTHTINGVFFSVVENPDSPTNTIMAAFKDGVAYEEENLWGISHFVEHILFRGTESYPTLYDLSRAVEGIGGQVSAYSTRDLAAYWVKSPSGSEDKSCGILSELLCRTSLKDEFIGMEKEIIKQERLRERNNPTFFNSLVLEQLLLSPDPISRHPVGIDSIVEGFDSTVLRKHIDRYYHGNNLFIGAAGNFSGSFIENMKNLVTCFPQGETPQAADFRVESDYPDASHYHIKSHHKNQVYLSVGWRIKPEDERELFAWRVLCSILGTGYTSLFNRVLREEENITYVCTTNFNLYDESGVYKINLALNEKNLKRAVELIDQIIGDVSQKKISREIFDEAVVKHASNVLFRMEDTCEIAKILSQNLLRNKQDFSLVEYFRSLDKVDFDEVASIASGLLENKSKKVLMMTGSELIEKCFSDVLVIEP
jgi:predicted Zn-dependent peptidase